MTHVCVPALTIRLHLTLFHNPLGSVRFFTPSPQVLGGLGGFQVLANSKLFIASLGCYATPGYYVLGGLVDHRCSRLNPGGFTASLDTLGVFTCTAF